MSDSAGGSNQLTVNVGETIKTRTVDGGPVVSHVSDVDPGETTKAVEVTVRRLRNAVDTDLEDSYKSVHIWCDGETAAVTDHRMPIDAEEATSLNTFTEALARTAVVVPTPDAVRSTVRRSFVCTALDEFASSETAQMLVDGDYPLVLVGDETAVAIAPIAGPDDVPRRSGGDD